MARLGQKTGDKDVENGKQYFGNKDAEYLKQQSRAAVEDRHDMPILFFEIDWENSARNFYGELTVKKFVNPQGIQIRGMYKLEQQEMTKFNNVPYQKMHLTVSIYTEQMQELGIEPKLNDYFSVGKRFYQIYKKTINDVGPGNLMMNREKMRCDYFAHEVDNEVVNKVNGDNEADQTGTVL